MNHSDPRLPDNVVPLRPADAERLVRELQGTPSDSIIEQLLRRSAPEPWAAPEQAQCFTVRIDLDDAQPPIWRRLALAGDLTLDELHDVLQAAMGWTDSHLHHFLMGPGERDHRREPFVEPYAESEGDDGIAERDVRLDQVVAGPGDRLFYDYDFGDGWEHTIAVESVTPLDADVTRARCLAGSRACPPEDVGGLPGYEEVLDALERPTAELSDWLVEKMAWLPDGYDPSAFDVVETDALVRRIASGGRIGLPHPDLLAPPLRDLLAAADTKGADLAAQWFAAAMEPVELDLETCVAITSPWRALLAVVGDGLALTGAGYLPPAVVTSLVEQLPVKHLWGKGNREEHTPPVADLHETARVLGLVRKAKGRLLPTALGRRLSQDPEALARAVVDRLAPGKRTYERDAEWLLVLAVAAGVEDPYVDIAGVLAGLGWRDGAGGLVQRHHAYHSVQHTRAVLGLAGWNPGRYADLEHDPRARILAQLALRA